MSATPERRLTVILHADVVGSTTLVQRDERLAHERIQDVFCRFSATIEQYSGYILELRGDALLAEFSRGSDGVSAALAFQLANRAFNVALGEELRAELRIGLSIGEVVVADNTVTGPGVVLAQRLEQLASAGGVVIQGALSEAVPTRLPFDYESLGEQTLKGFDQPVRAYSVSLRSGESLPEPASRETAAASPPDRHVSADQVVVSEKPSIAVLPFDNMSSDPEQEYFGDGLAEDVITTLSKVSSLFVIARNSSFAYKGKATDVRRIANDLGVRYVLEGSVRSSGPRIRVSAQLIDSADGSHLWAERYDRKLEDIFDIQDEITREIVTALRIRLTDGEQAQLFLKDTLNVEAWSLAFGALDKIMLGNPAAVAEARDLLERAVGLDTEFATAHALIGISHYFDIHFGFTSDPDRSAQRLSASTDRALELEPNSPLACCDRALLHLFREDLDAAVEYGRRAVALSPNDAFLKVALGRILIHAGILNEAESEVRAAMRINPFYPTYYFGVLANALEMQGKDEEAIELVQAAVQRDANYFSGHLRLASLLGIAGKTDAARAHAEQALRISPRIDRALLKGFYPTNNPEALARFLGGLDAAGIRID